MVFSCQPIYVNLEKEKIKKEAIEKYEEEHEQQIISRYNEDYSNRQKMIILHNQEYSRVCLKSQL